MGTGSRTPLHGPPELTEGGEASPWVLRPSPAGAHSVPRGGPELQTAESVPAPVSPPSARSTLHGTPSPESTSDFRPCPRPLGDTASVPPSFECFRLYSTSLRPTGSLPDSGRHSVAAARLALQTARRLRATSLGHCSLSPSKVSGHELLWGLSRGSLMRVCGGPSPSGCWAGGARFSLQGVNVGP